MPQLQLPIFSEDMVPISMTLAFKKEADQVIYFSGAMPVFTHPSNDVDTFHMITSQFCVNGNATQAQIVRAFGVTEISVKRAVKRYRTQGAKGFYAPRNTRGAAVLTATVLAEVQQLLEAGHTVNAIAEKLNLKANTLDKAIRAGRLHKPPKKNQR